MVVKITNPGSFPFPFFLTVLVPMILQMQFGLLATWNHFANKTRDITLSWIMLKNGQTYLNILRCEHLKNF